MCSNWSKQIADIERGKEPIVYVGNLEAKRDFSDVRDMVKAYWLAASKGKDGEAYNVCSGSAWVMNDILNYLIGKSDKKIDKKQDPSRMRPSDVPVLIGDSTKFREATGWKNEIPFEKTLEDTLNYWREKLR